MLLNKCVLDGITASRALNIPHVLVTDPPMALQLKDAHQSRANRTLNLSVLTLIAIVNCKVGKLYRGPALQVYAHECQSLEDFGDLSWEGATSHIHRAAERTDIWIINRFLKLIEAGRTHLCFALLAARRVRHQYI